MEWSRLPSDILRRILPYTYSPQPAALLEDIRDFRPSQARAGAYFYETFVVGWHETEPEDRHWFANELYCFTRYTKHRAFELQGRSVEAEINVMWGSLTPEDRRQFMMFMMYTLVHPYEMVAPASLAQIVAQN